jgi:hypothetical protein
MSAPGGPEGPRQAATVERLGRLVGPGAAGFYADACRLMSDEHVFESTTHLVSHLLREVESAVRAVLQPLSGKGSADEGHRLEILRALKSLDIPEDHPAAIAWLSLPGKANEYGFAARAHRDDLAAPRPVDDRFLLFWRNVESLLYVVLDRLEANYLSAASIINRLKAVDKPSKGHASEFLQRVPHTFSAHQQFFGGLSDSRWLQPLRDVGAFRRPPAAVTGEKDGKPFISLEGWPEGDYLERMAGVREAQATVAEILHEVPESDNLRVHTQLAGVALALPPDAILRWVERERAWLVRQGVLFLPTLVSRFGKLVSHLIQGGHTEQAFDLFDGLIALQAPPRPENAVDDEIAAYFDSQPRAHMDGWHYSEILERVAPVLAASDDLRTLRILSDHLGEAIRFSRHQRLADGSDTSYIWRRAIEADHDEYVDEIPTALVAGLRKTAEAVLAIDPVRLAAVIDLLEARASTSWVFKRMALHLLRVRRGFADVLVAERLTDSELFHELSVRHEYTLLLGEAYPHIGEPSRAAILKMIDTGPIIPEPVPLAEGELADYRRTWTRDRLSAIASFLPFDWKARYETLVQELGEARHPEYPYYVSAGSFLGGNSPKTSEAIRAMDPESIAEFLRNWLPSADGIGSSSPDALGHALTDAVKSDPARFSASLYLFTDLEATYARSLLEGFFVTAQGGSSFEWRPVLEFCGHVVEKPALPNDSRPAVLLGRDPDWSWARGKVEMLLQVGLAEGAARIPIELRAEVWKSLLPLTSDPDPTPKRDAEIAARPGGQSDLGQYGLRGRALRSVVRYLEWVRRHLGDGWKGFESAPEADAVLAEHLDPVRDSSVSVRSMYGETLGTLFWLDRDWTRAQVPRILPREPEHAALRFSTWQTYLSHWRPTTGLFELLKGDYAEAIAALSADGDPKRPIPAEEAALAEHLMVLYGRGEIGLESGGLVTSLFSQGSARLRAHAIWSVGCALGNGERGRPSDAVLGRLRALWRWRLGVEAAGVEQASVSLATSELLSFGWWFASGAFDPSWAAGQLLIAYEKAGSAPAEYWVLVQLAEVASEIPLKVVKILRAMAVSSNDGLQFSAHRAEVTRALEPALDGSDPGARAIAVEVINRLASKGASEFSSLLDRESGSTRRRTDS